MAESTITLMHDMMTAAIGSALADDCVPRHLPERPAGRTLVIGAGKASAAMAAAVEAHWGGGLQGLVVVPYGHACACREIEIREAAHPVPDAAGLDAATRVMALVRDLADDDLVLCLISGGGSALLPLPLPGLSLDDEQDV
ncbi:MAG: DUF4147 domain-containing protein, partial [Gammaproteobacteria bacterium]|nr:DUF4147 domain-containing protein [Gammaproteobacteria bacterium]